MRSSTAPMRSIRPRPSSLNARPMRRPSVETHSLIRPTTLAANKKALPPNRAKRPSITASRAARRSNRQPSPLPPRKPRPKNRLPPKSPPRLLKNNNLQPRPRSQPQKARPRSCRQLQRSQNQMGVEPARSSQRRVTPPIGPRDGPRSTTQTRRQTWPARARRPRSLTRKPCLWKAWTTRSALRWT